MVLAMADTRPNRVGAEEGHPSETTATTTAATSTATETGQPTDRHVGPPNPNPKPTQETHSEHHEGHSAQEQVEEVKLEAVQDNNVELVTEILGDISGLQVRDDSATELSKILQEPHFQSLLEAHDIVASKCYEVPPPAEMANEAAEELVIARILHGGMIERQGLLHVGDVIKEVNGTDVGSNPGELQELLRDCSGGITLKILPSYRDAPAPPQVYVRPHFDYDPANDNLIPCREAGISFKRGDILQIVNREDPNWWQACQVDGGATGLIPSQFLEEKRKAFVPRDFEGSDFDRHELQIYEEVAKMPPFQRKTLVLIGAQGVGRRSLKNRLVVLTPERFGTTIPFTSRRPRDEELDGNSYHFTSRLEMEADVKAGRFLEHGEYDGNLYGTKMESIHQALKVLKTAEFMPYVVFIAAPEFETLKAMHKAVDVDLRKTVDESARIQRAYNHYFDLTIVNDNLDKAFETLQAAVDKLCSEAQWVPVNWVY
ncbi:hypothetical protein CRUP_012999 [Coryphaenoides rupestris]|nr:hypothetical protein CRUP_012999 [Coryphaenoides rupestris]